MRWQANGTCVLKVNEDSLLDCEVMSFNPLFYKTRAFKKLPILKKAGTRQIFHYLERTSTQTSSNSSDPTLISKTTDPKLPGVPHEVDR